MGKGQWGILVVIPGSEGQIEQRRTEKVFHVSRAKRGSAEVSPGSEQGEKDGTPKPKVKFGWEDKEARVETNPAEPEFYVNLENALRETATQKPSRTLAATTGMEMEPHRT